MLGHTVSQQTGNIELMHVANIVSLGSILALFTVIYLCNFISSVFVLVFCRLFMLSFTLCRKVNAISIMGWQLHLLIAEKA